MLCTVHHIRYIHCGIWTLILDENSCRFKQHPWTKEHTFNKWFNTFKPKQKSVLCSLNVEKVCLYCVIDWRHSSTWTAAGWSLIKKPHHVIITTSRETYALSHLLDQFGCSLSLSMTAQSNEFFHLNPNSHLMSMPEIPVPTHTLTHKHTHSHLFRLSYSSSCFNGMEGESLRTQLEDGLRSALSCLPMLRIGSHLINNGCLVSENMIDGTRGNADVECVFIMSEIVSALLICRQHSGSLWMSISNWLPLEAVLYSFMSFFNCISATKLEVPSQQY